MKIGIIGGGATGLTAAYELSKLGHNVSVFEMESEYAGLVKSIDVGIDKLENFYHHIFTNDVEIIDLIDELGLASDLMWLSPKNGIYSNNKLYPFTSPLDLLMFKELSPIDRIRLGLLVYKAKFIKNWTNLEKTEAKSWIIKNAGENVYDKVWRPLLYSKFDFDSDSISATWIWNKLKLRGSTRDKNISRELLGYMKGSFSKLYDKLAEKIIESGGKIYCSTMVESIKPNEDKTIDIITNSSSDNFDRVIVTVSPNILTRLKLPFDRAYSDRLNCIKYKANICMLLELSEQLSPYYWITVADTQLPFALVLEHTNLVPKESYNSNIVYLSRYLDEKNPLFTDTDENIKDIFICGLKKMFPNWDESSIKNTHISRAKYSQPVISKNYSKTIPGYDTPIQNLYLASMAQIYPEDRGQNYAIKLGKKISKLVIENK